MGEGLWVVLGTAIGALGSVVANWLNLYWARQSKYPAYDEAIEALLKKMLETGPKWRKIETLMHVTGLSEQDTKEYLITMHARGSETNGKLWGLISRNPLSEIDKSSEPI
jgi:hypothetical protein